jgi:hypothetical protein
MSNIKSFLAYSKYRWFKIAIIGLIVIMAIFLISILIILIDPPIPLPPG